MNGRFHRRVTILASLPTGALAYALTQDVTIAWAASSGCLVGLVIHPDLDVSRSWLWAPYSKSFRHRSPWTHWPVVSTIVRILYLMGWLALGLIPAALVWQAWGGSLEAPIITARDFMAGLAMLWGLMISDSLHWLMDVISSRWKRATNRKRRASKKRLYAS